MSKTALVVHPNPNTQRRANQALATLGFRVVSANGVRESMMQAGSASVDVVLSGVRLPDGSGYELARTLRESHPAALVFLLSGGFDVYDAEQAASCGVDGRVSVPFTTESLRTRIEASLGPLSVDEDAGDPLSYKGPLMVDDEPTPLAASTHPAPPVSSERMASFVPRDGRQPDPVAVDPAVVGPALERAILEVLPEVVEGVLRTALASNPDFRGLVEKAIQDAVAAKLKES